MAINTSSSVGINEQAVAQMDKAIIISGMSRNMVDSYVTLKREDNVKSFTFNVFSLLAPATTPLVDYTQATSTSQAATSVILTPKEYGKVLTQSKLASLITAGKADLAAAETIGINMGATTDKLGLLALESGSNTFNATTAGTLSKLDLRKAYTQLTTAGIAKFPDNRYVAFLNPQQVSDLKDDFGDIYKYTNAEAVTNGTVGHLEGFTIIEDANVTAGKVSCMGYNALGKAVSLNAQLVIRDGMDNLGRTHNIGWLGVMKYGVIDDNALRVIGSA